MDEGEGNDHMDQFHRSEAISAVADEGFMGDEDEDYEDLYNDVNVGEGFLQSMRGKSDVGGVEETKVEPPPQLQPPKAAQESGGSIPGVGGGSGDGTGGGGDGGARFGQSLGFRGNEIGVKGGGGGGVSGPGIRVELGPGPGVSKGGEFEERSGNSGVGVQGIVHQQPPGPPMPMPIPIPQQPPNHVVAGGGVGNVNGGGGGAVTTLFVGDLHWWTTDAELESELCKYGQVKEVKFFDEKASGKSKGYCQVEFYDPAAATACKEGMNGHVFNGRACVVAFASPFSVKRMGEAQVNRSQQMATQSSTVTHQARRGQNEPVGKPAGNNIATGGNYQGGGVENNNSRGGYGRGNWGRGNMQGMGNRGPIGQMRNRGGGAMGARGIMGNGGSGFGQGMGATPPLMHPQSMMGQGFDPSFGAPMGRMGAYGTFPGAPTPPFSGILSSFPPVGLPNVAAHVNPAFFGRGMPMNGMGMMPTGAVDGPNMMWSSDPQMGSWGPGGDDHNGGRAGESSYGEEAASDHQYGEASHERGAWPNSMKDKDRASERDWSGSSDRRYRDDREQQQQGYERDPPREKDAGHEDWPERRHRDDRDPGRERDRERDRERPRSRDRERDRDRERHRDDRYSEHHRYKDREAEHDDEWDRGRSSRTHSSKGGRSGQDDDHRSRSRDADYGKRRRLTSE